MGGLFYKLGRMAGPKIRQARWAYLAATAPREEVVAAEFAVGSDMAGQVRNHFQISPPSELSRQLSQTGQSLVHCLKDQSRRFSFECMVNDDPEAFCLPGGFVFVSTGMMRLCGEGSDMIAFVLGHEMAHILEGHAMQRMLTGSLVSAATRAGHLRAVTTGALGKAGVQFLEKAYSQENELRADAMALRLAAAAGYDPAGAIDLFLKLKPLANETALGKYFSTHPKLDDRIESVRKMITKM